jgi:hypothetical protein
VDANDLTDNLRIRIARIDGRDAAESGYMRVSASGEYYRDCVAWPELRELWQGDRQAWQEWQGDWNAWRVFQGDRQTWQEWQGDWAAFETWQGDRQRYLADLQAWQRAAGSRYSRVFSFKKEEGSITITGYKGRLKAVFIPAAIDGIPVVGINGKWGMEAWSGAFTRKGLTWVSIPDSVTFIGDEAFRYNNLTRVVIPDSVTSIGEGAFYNNELTSVVIPNSVTSIEDDAFAGNALTSVVIPNSVTSIGAGAFGGNELTSITIGSNVALPNYYLAFPNDFDHYYHNSGKKAGTYVYADRRWTGPR